MAAYRRWLQSHDSLTAPTDTQSINGEQITAPYHQRWGIETTHNKMKDIVAIEHGAALATS